MIEWGDVSSTGPATTRVLQAMDEARRALANAGRMLAADASAAPDIDDLVEAAGEVAAVAENLTALNNLVIDAYVATRQRGARC
jgi:hypothetical protein